MSSAARKVATYQDVLDAPRHMVAEIIHGTLQLMPRPRSTHARASTRLSSRLGPPFDEGDGGPGGWLILFEPELHLGEDILVPDIGGWRRERMPEMPDAPFFSLAPDWVCEVLSPTTATVDRSQKVPIYAQQRVQYVWLLDPGLQTLEVLKLDGPTYRLHQTFAKDAAVRAEPFDAIAIELKRLWER